MVAPARSLAPGGSEGNRAHGLALESADKRRGASVGCMPVPQDETPLDAHPRAPREEAPLRPRPSPLAARGLRHARLAQPGRDALRGAPARPLARRGVLLPRSLDPDDDRARPLAR